jgi:hypothetical protein
LLGQDTSYYRRSSDDDLIKRAKEEDRVLLTLDEELFRRATLRGAKAFLVSGDTELEKLVGVAREFDIDLTFLPELSRCPVCGSTLKSVPRDSVKSKLPSKVAERFESFWQCCNCSKIYWPGSHLRRIDEALKRARRLARPR